MLISRDWLQKFFDSPLPPVESIADALTFHAFEIESIQQIKNSRQAASPVRGDDASDEVLDVKVTPNRGHDCLSYAGIAKEVSAILKMPLNHNPFLDAANLNPKTDAVAVTVEDSSLAPRYIAAYVKGVKVGPSPEWLVERLGSIGQRSINNIVDAANFVMFNIGQPLHAFDADTLIQKDGKYLIVVRKAREGEKIATLDEREYTLKSSMLVIADGNADVPIGIAGIKGGKRAAVTEVTKDIIIESANFSGVSVRKTAQALPLRTDASARFEQQLSPELAGAGMRAAVDWILKIAGGEVVGFADVCPAPSKPWSVSVTVEKVNQVLGAQLSAADVSDAFTRLGFQFQNVGNNFTVTPPYERLDLLIAEDLVEEVGRIVGYDTIPAVPLSPFPKQPEVNSNFYAAEKTRQDLVAQGYCEVYTSVFADKGARAVLNKIDSVRPYMRENLTDGLAAALKKNLPNKDLLGLKEVKLFEIGSVWQDGKEITMVGRISEKEAAKEWPLEPIASQTYENIPISNTVRYQAFSRYPYIVRDVAMWVPKGTHEDDVLQMIKKEAGELAVRVIFFDRFEKEDKISLAYRIIFQSFERTLTEGEANAAMEKVYAALKNMGFEIR
ncbi:MAG TPA: phenylalanine--tRNA ligase subunit beta [Candidatus Paceibacterota bacterium]|nr:phenylalanine--tRNA ligase subunit beta [Candidatus Paceibacterota bacterium]